MGVPAKESGVLSFGNWNDLAIYDARSGRFFFLADFYGRDSAAGAGQGKHASQHGRSIPREAPRTALAKKTVDSLSSNTVLVSEDAASILSAILRLNDVPNRSRLLPEPLVYEGALSGGRMAAGAEALLEPGGRLAEPTPHAPQDLNTESALESGHLPTGVGVLVEEEDVPSYLARRNYMPEAIRSCARTSAKLTLDSVCAATTSGRLRISGKNGRSAWRELLEEFRTTYKNTGSRIDKQILRDAERHFCDCSGVELTGLPNRYVVPGAILVLLAGCLTLYNPWVARKITEGYETRARASYVRRALENA